MSVVAMLKHNEPQRINGIVNSFLSEKGYLTVLKEQNILHKWPKIIENVLPGSCTCKKIENGIVYVKTASSSCRQEALYHKEILFKRIKDECNCSTIKDIVFY